jgi:hypothetical protein
VSNEDFVVLTSATFDLLSKAEKLDYLRRAIAVRKAGSVFPLLDDSTATYGDTLD